MKLYNIEISGNLLSETLLENLCKDNCKNKFIQPDSFKWEKFAENDNQKQFEERIATAYENILGKWDIIRTNIDSFNISDLREKWLKYFFGQFGFNLQYQKSDIVADSGNKFPLSHRGWNDNSAPVIHTVKFIQDLDKKVDDDSRHKYSPHDTLQRYLNQSENDLWAIVTNGKELRILRDFHHQTRKAYISFNLHAIFESRNYSDFKILWYLIHPSRFCINPEIQLCPLESLFNESKAAGTAAGEGLRLNVKFAIEELANGFLLKTPELTDKLIDNEENCKKFHRQILRVIYRLIFLLYAEQRNLISGKSALYEQEYSISALRTKIETGYIPEDTHTDLWEGLKVTFNMVYQGVPELNIPHYNGELFRHHNIGWLLKSKCRNDNFLKMIKYITTIDKGGFIQRISYVELSVDEIGSIYESLLEFIPRVCSQEQTIDDINIVKGKNKSARRTIPVNTFFLDPRGTTRKTSGSYYTNPALVNALIESALKPVLEEKLKQAGPNYDLQEDALLSLRVCDPACGSGAFIIGATEYLGEQLARIRVRDDYPADKDIRKARRDVLRHCIYGVDINPLSVELAKVSLWLTAATDIYPLNFLDHKIKCGNSLIGTTPELLKNNIPVDAYAPVEGDDKTLANKRKVHAKTYYKLLEKKKTHTTIDFDEETKNKNLIECEDLSDKYDESSSENIEQLRNEYYEIREKKEFKRNKLLADYWTSAFFWEHNNEKDNTIKELKNESEKFSTNKFQKNIEKEYEKDGKKYDGNYDGKYSITDDKKDSRNEFQNYNDDYDKYDNEYPNPFDLEKLLEKPELDVNANLKKKINSLAKEHQFFHWYLEFPEVFKNGGFDCVLGNPPFDVIKENKLFKFLPSGGTANLYAHFIFLNVSILCKNASIGLVVPLSFTCGSKFENIRQCIYNNFQELRVRNYSIRPSKLFENVDQRITLFTAKNKGHSPCSVFSTRLHRWYKKDEDTILSNPVYGNAGFLSKGLIPKIAGDIGKSIYKKIIQQKYLIKDYINDYSKNFIYCHGIARYWIKAYNFIPYFKRENENTSISTAIKILNAIKKEYVQNLIILINSSLFYYWWLTQSDEFNILLSEIINFGVPDENNILWKNDKIINLLVDNLMKSYKKNAYRKEIKIKGKKIIYDEFYPRKSLKEIHAIDDYVAKLYNLTEEENNFLKTYDYEFRTDNE